MSSQDPVSRKTTLQDSYTEMSEILMPNDTNNLGRALGGSVCSTGWIFVEQFLRAASLIAR